MKVFTQTQYYYHLLVQQGYQSLSLNQIIDRQLDQSVVLGKGVRDKDHLISLGPSLSASESEYNHL